MFFSFVQVYDARSFYRKSSLPTNQNTTSWSSSRLRECATVIDGVQSVGVRGGGKWTSPKIVARFSDTSLPVSIVAINQETIRKLSEVNKLLRGDRIGKVSNAFGDSLIRHEVRIYFACSMHRFRSCNFTLKTFTIYKVKFHFNVFTVICQLLHTTRLLHTFSCNEEIYSFQFARDDWMFEI